MQFIYHTALLLAGFHLSLATPVSDSALEERDLVRRACAPTGQESCCAKGYVNKILGFEALLFDPRLPGLILNIASTE